MNDHDSSPAQRRLGILGGGQLGRMLAFAAGPLGLRVTVLDPSADAPARAAANHIRAPYEDETALKELSKASWVTFEFENVPDQSARELSATTLVAPPPRALEVARDRWIEKNTFRSLGIATADFRKVDDWGDARAAFEQLGPLIFKTRSFGYDGKGQARVHAAADLRKAYDSLHGASAIAEAFVPFDRELSVILCRAKTGESVVYPVTQNIHHQGILRTSIAPAPDLDDAVARSAKDAIGKLADHLDYVGVLALELFQVGDQLIANEFAPRVHNSGHWTIEGSLTSQFENHVRAVTGLPLGSPDLRAPAVMVNLIGRVPALAELLAIEDAHVHDYDKRPRPGRKVGHVTCLGKTAKEAAARADQVQLLVDAADDEHSEKLHAGEY